jgi:hypothetical protein
MHPPLISDVEPALQTYPKIIQFDSRAMSFLPMIEKYNDREL